MASEQLIRKTHDQKDDVPQVTHFESVTVTDSGPQPAVVHRVVETIHTAKQVDQQQQTRDQAQKNNYGGKQVDQQQQTRDQARKNNYGLKQVDQQQQTRDQARKNNYGGKKEAQVEKSSQQTGEQKTGLTDVGATYVGEKAMETAEYASQGASLVKDAALAAGRGATELATGVADTVKDVSKKGASYIGEKAIAGKDITLDAGKTAIGYVGSGAGVVKDGVRESMESLNEGVARAVEGSTIVTEIAGQKVLEAGNTLVDLGKKGAEYIGKSAVTGKDITSKTGKAVARYASKASDVVKDATLVGGWRAMEMASDTETGLTASMEDLNAGVGGIIEGTAMATEGVVDNTLNTAVDVGKKGASYVGEKVVAGRDVTLETGNKAAGVVKDATLVGGWSAMKMASDTATGLTTSLENLNAGVGGLVEGTATATENVVQKTFNNVVDVGKKGANYVGDKVITGRDVTLEAGKATGKYGGKAAGVVKDAALVGGWSAVEVASDTASGVTDSMETLNEGVAGLIEGTSLATEDVARKTFSTMVDVGKKGASYIGEKVVAGKDVTLEAGKAATEYVSKGASVVKDTTLVGGWSALELASDTTKGVTESMENVNEGVTGLVENAAIVTEGAVEKATGIKDVAIDMGKKGASYIGEKGVEGKDTTLQMCNNTGEYIGKAAGVVNDAALVAGWSAAELASDTMVGVTESIEDVNVGVAGLVEGTACATEDVVKKTIATISDVVKSGDMATERGATKFTSDNPIKSKGNLSVEPKNIVVEREEVSIGVDKTRKT